MFVCSCEVRCSEKYDVEWTPLKRFVIYVSGVLNIFKCAFTQDGFLCVMCYELCVLVL